MGAKPHKILKGQKFNYLTILSEIPKDERGRRRKFNVQCKCGNTLTVTLDNLISGNTKSCGCYKVTPKGKDSYSWKGGKHITKKGYVLIYMPDHSRAKSNGYVYEHIIIMMKHLNRELLPGENIHHLNGVRSDNRLENLELWSSSQPSGQRVKDKIKWAKEILEIYKDFDYEN